MRVTLRDVAASAGVSIKTVSNVVTARVPVKISTRTKVEKAINSLGYHPNIAARDLRSGRSSTIGLVLPELRTRAYAAFADAVLELTEHYNQSILLQRLPLTLNAPPTLELNSPLNGSSGVIWCAATFDARLVHTAMRLPLVVVAADTWHVFASSEEICRQTSPRAAAAAALDKLSPPLPFHPV